MWCVKPKRTHAPCSNIVLQDQHACMLICVCCAYTASMLRRFSPDQSLLLALTLAKKSFQSPWYVNSCRQHATSSVSLSWPCALKLGFATLPSVQQALHGSLPDEASAQVLLPMCCQPLQLHWCCKPLQLLYTEGMLCVSCADAFQNQLCSARPISLGKVADSYIHSSTSCCPGCGPAVHDSMPT